MSPGLYDITALVPLITQGYTVLTPNSRLARHIKAEWDANRRAAGYAIWESVPVQPLESWLFSQWERAVELELLPPLMPLRAAQALEVWRQVIEGQNERKQQYHLLQPAAAAELACAAYDALRRWQVDLCKFELRQAFQLDDDCAAFLSWLTRFEARLAAAGQCTLSDCLAQLPALEGQLARTRVVLVECEEIAPLLLAALQALRAEDSDSKLQNGPARRLLYSYSDHRAELQAVAAWATSLHRTSPTATIGIVPGNTADKVALEYLLRREFNCLGDNYNSLPVNFSSGITLTQTPLVRDALLALSMGLQHTTVPAVVGLLRSRFLNIADAQSALAQRLVTRLYADGREELSVADLRLVVSGMTPGEQQGLQIGQRLRDLVAMQELRRRALPSVWVARFSALLSLWGWPGSGALDSIEYQQLDLWYRTLDELRNYDAVCLPVDFAQALRLLRNCCNRQISQPQTADSAVQVLGPLEAAGLAFDHLWLCGMQGSSWPAAPYPNPFIPINLQARLRMPHASAAREWEYGQVLLAQYTRTCHTVHASFCRQLDGVPDLPSPLLRDFVLQPTSELPRVSPAWFTSFATRKLEHLIDDNAPRLVREEYAAIRGGSSLLESQSQCSFRAFAKHRLAVEPLGSFRIALSTADRGALLHAALSGLWGAIVDSAALHALHSTQQQLIIENAVQAALATIPVRKRSALGRAYWELEAQRLATLLQEWLVVERERSPFTVVQREKDIELELAKLPLQLRVDRVDQLPDGSRVLIDYKSAECTVQDWLGERPARPQLLLYGMAESEPAAALAFAQVRARNCRYVGLGRSAVANGIGADLACVVRAPMPAADWSTLNVHWRETLERIATAFVSGEARVDPLAPASCQHCGLQSLCRVDIGSPSIEVEPG